MTRLTEICCEIPHATTGKAGVNNVVSVVLGIFKSNVVSEETERVWGPEPIRALRAVAGTLRSMVDITNVSTITGSHTRTSRHAQRIVGNDRPGSRTRHATRTLAENVKDSSIPGVSVSELWRRKLQPAPASTPTRAAEVQITPSIDIPYTYYMNIGGTSGNAYTVTDRLDGTLDFRITAQGEDNLSFTPAQLQQILDQLGPVVRNVTDTTTIDIDLQTFGGTQANT